MSQQPGWTVTAETITGRRGVSDEDAIKAALTARAAGLRITLAGACPGSDSSTWYEADARAWGTGRGIGPGGLGRREAPQPSRPGALHWHAALGAEAEAQQ